MDNPQLTIDELRDQIAGRASGRMAPDVGDVLIGTSGWLSSESLLQQAVLSVLEHA
jgi:hypothetical protein